MRERERIGKEDWGRERERKREWVEEWRGVSLP